MINKEKNTFDPRVYLLLMFASILMGMIIYSEVMQALLFIVSAIWIIIGLKGEKLFSYIMGYFVLWGISQICIYFVTLDEMNTFAIFIANLCNMGRKAFPAILFIMIVGKQSTGALLGSFYAMGVPKAFGIGIATMLRFFPTLSEEYRYIRNAEKFRGIGVGFWHTLVHLPSVLGNVFIPLLIRITKISEELAASVTVRGVRFYNEVISFKEMKFTNKDGMAVAITITTMILIFIADTIFMRGLM